MNTELFIEGQSIDLTGDVVIPVNFNVANVKVTKERKASYTKTIKVPGTKNNNIAFNNSYDVQNAVTEAGPRNINIGFNRKKKASFQLVTDGANVLTGTAQLRKVRVVDGRVEYDVVLYGELTNIITALQDKDLRDLDASSLNHTVTLNSIVDSWDGLTDYTYPLIDYGILRTRMESVHTGNFRPAVYVKWYIDKIFEEAGFTYESSFMDSEKFNNLIIPFNGAEFNTFIDFADSIISTDENQPVFQLSDQPFKPYDLIIEDEDSYYDITTETYTAPVTTDIDVHLAYKPILAWSPDQGTSSNVGDEMRNNAFDIIINLKQNGTTIRTKTVNVPQNTFQSTGSATGFFGSQSKFYNIEASWSAISVTENDTLTVEVSTNTASAEYAYNTTTSSQWPANIFLNTAYSPTSRLVFTDQNLIGRTLKGDEFVIRNLSQKDLLIGVLRLFNLYIVPDKNQPRHFKIIERDEFYAQGGNVDWTDKLVIDRVVENELVKESLIETLQFKYKHDEDDYYLSFYKNKYGREYGERRVATGYEFNEGVRDVLELPFGTAVPIQYAPGSDGGDTLIEVREDTPDIIQIQGYQAIIDEGETPGDDFPTFEKAGEGRIVRIGEFEREITGIINPYQIEVASAIPDTVQPDALPGFRISAYQFTYTGYPDKVIPAIFESDDGSVTRESFDSEPRILMMNGTIPCNFWTLWQEPQQFDGINNYIYNENLPVSRNIERYPFVSHVSGSSPTEPVYDMLFQPPSEIFWSLEDANIGPDIPSDIPDVTTVSVTQETISSVRFDGQVTVNSGTVSYGYSYKQTSSSNWTYVEVGTTTSSISYNAVQSVVNGVEYEFRAQAYNTINPFGQVYGEIQTITVS